MMKKILLLLFILVSFFASGQVLQEPNVYGYKFKRVGADSLLFIPSDTLRIPTSYNGLSYVAKIGSTLYYWGGTKWLSLVGSGSTYTFTNGITESGGTVESDTSVISTLYALADSIYNIRELIPASIVSFGKNATKDSVILTLSDGSRYAAKDSSGGGGTNIYNSDGTLTGNRVVSGGGTHSLVIDSINGLYLGYGNGNSFDVYDYETGNTQITVDKFVSRINSPDGTSTVKLFNDSLFLDANKIKIPILPYTLSTTGKKIMLRDTATGLVQNIDPALITGDMTIYTRQQDTATLATFTAGARLQADTALFTDSTLYGSFYNDGSDTLIITKMLAVMNGGTSDTLGVQVYFNDTINVVGSAVATSTLACNSTTVGNSTTTFTNYKIPPGNWVWMKTPTVVAGRKPYYLSVSLIGYKKRVY